MFLQDQDEVDEKDIIHFLLDFIDDNIDFNLYWSQFILLSITEKIDLIDLYGKKIDWKIFVTRRDEKKEIRDSDNGANGFR